MTTKVIAYYNLGVEYEYLSSLDDAWQAYESAKHLAMVYLGPETPLLNAIDESLQKLVNMKMMKEKKGKSRKDNVFTKPRGSKGGTNGPSYEYTAEPKFYA